MSRSVGQPTKMFHWVPQSCRSAALLQQGAEKEMVDDLSLSKAAASDIGKNLDPLLLRAARGEVCRSVGQA